MESTTSTQNGDLFAWISLSIVVVTELLCLLGYSILARLVQQKDTFHQLYRQDAFKVSAVANIVWGFAMTVVYLPISIALLGWHRSLDHHPIVCLIIYLVLAMIFSFITMSNMFVTGLMLGVSIIFPLHFERVFKRRTVMLIVLFVWLTPTVLITTFGLFTYIRNDHFSRSRIQCLAGLDYWPAWMKQVAVFCFIIPVMTETFVINFYVLFVAWKQSKRQIMPEARSAPAFATPGGSTNISSLATQHVDSRARPTAKQPCNRCLRWKGTWMVLLLFCSVVFFLIPVYGAMTLSAVCENCIPPDV